jgi:truncated hemoglobin YjbI
MNNKLNMKDKVVGIGYYRREQWLKLLETAADAHILEKTYDEWLEILDSSMGKIRRYGVEPELIYVDVDELLSFCKKKGLQNNASARSMFIAELSRKKKETESE